MNHNRQMIPRPNHEVAWGAAYSVVKVPIIDVKLVWEALKSIAAWWRGEISGKRCVSQIVGSVVTVASTVGGGYAGALIGTILFPVVGTVVGGAIGGLAGGVIGSLLSEWLTENLFDLPKSQALENAYRFLNLLRDCSNGDINEAYHRLALIHHPDKGGNKDEWIKLQCAVQIIKESRGEGL